MISGLIYKENVLTAEQEADLICFLDSEQPWMPLSNSPNSRRVQHYGYRYDYRSGSTKSVATPIPQAWTESRLFQPMEEDIKWNQVIVNEYQTGQGISAHVDSFAYGDTILCYTLGSGATMRFTHSITGERKDLYVAPRSVYIMTGEARYQWKHEMISRKSDIVDGKKIQRGRRISITLRIV